LKCDYPAPPLAKHIKRARKEPIVELLESEDENYEDPLQIEDGGSICLFNFYF
jgi:hypothetical protein